MKGALPGGFSWKLSVVMNRVPVKMRSFWSAIRHLRTESDPWDNTPLWSGRRAGRVGHGIIVCVAEFNHPIKIAERTAVLDILSSGRLQVGPGHVSERPRPGSDRAGLPRREVSIAHFMVAGWTDGSWPVYPVYAPVAGQRHRRRLPAGAEGSGAGDRR